MNRTALCLFIVAAVAACEEPTDAGSFAVTGHIENRTNAPIPANTRILAVWGVSAGSPDYSYVFGEGTLNRITGTFQIRFDEPPPNTALNRDALGVGFIIATTDQSMHVGDVITSSSQMTGVIGITGQYAVIFVQNRDTLTTDWVSRFDDGYSVGVGVPASPPEVFDTFAPTGHSSPVLIIDAMGNIEIVNWT